MWSVRAALNVLFPFLPYIPFLLLGSLFSDYDRVS